MRKSSIKSAVAVAGVSSKNKRNVHVVEESPPTVTVNTEKQPLKNRVEKSQSHNNLKKTSYSVTSGNHNHKKNKVDAEIIDLSLDDEVPLPAPKAPISVDKREPLPKKKEKVVVQQPLPTSTPLSEDQLVLQRLEIFYNNHGLTLDEVYLALRTDSMNNSSEEIYWESSTLPIPEGYTREKVANVIKPMQDKQNNDKYLSPMIMAIELNKKVNSNKSKNRAKIRQELINKKKKTSENQESSSSSSSCDKKSPEESEVGFDDDFPIDDLNDSQILLFTQQAEELYENKKIHSNKTPRLDDQSVIKLKTPQPSSQKSTPVSTRNLRSSSNGRSSVSFRNNQSLFEDSNSSVTPARSNISQFRSPTTTRAVQKPINKVPTKTLFKSSTPIRPTTKTDESPSNMFNDDDDGEMDRLLSQIPIPSITSPSTTTTTVTTTSTTIEAVVKQVANHGHGSHSLNKSNITLSFSERTTEIISDGDEDSYFQKETLDEINRMEENALNNNNVLKPKLSNKVTNHQKLKK